MAIVGECGYLVIFDGKESREFKVNSEGEAIHKIFDFIIEPDSKSLGVKDENL